MRILLDLQGTQTESRFRGIGRYSIELATAIARNAGGHDLWIALCGSLPETVEPARARFTTLVPEQNIKVFECLTPLTAICSDNRWRARSSELMRESFIAALRPDVIHIASMFEGLSDDVVSSVGLLPTTMRTAVTLYDLIPLTNPDEYLGNPSVEEWYFRKMRYLTAADLLLAISSHSRDEAMRHIGVPADRLVNIGSGVDARFRPLELAPEDRERILQGHGISRPFVMYSGAVEARKNINGLIDAFGLLPDSVRKVHQLVIVGRHDTHARERLRIRVSQARLNADQVVYTGYVSDAELVALYNLCAVFVLPSFEEGFGLPALEAMSCGAATLGADATSIPEVVGLREALFDPRSPSSIANRMLRALRDESFCTSLKEHGLRQSLKFTWDKSAQAALSAFEQLGSAQVLSSKRSPDNGRLRKPRLALVSAFVEQHLPLAVRLELLYRLRRHYDIELIAPSELAISLSLRCNFNIRTLSEFHNYVNRYDRILYEVADSPHHSAIIDSLRLYPGTVILQDFFFSRAWERTDQVCKKSDRYVQELVVSHGHSALMTYKQRGREKTKDLFPCSRSILDSAAGVLSTLPLFKRMADRYYGKGTSADWRDISFLGGTHQPGRSESRKRLGLDEFIVVCCFSPSDSAGVLQDAWLKSKYAYDSNARLLLLQSEVAETTKTLAGLNEGGPSSNTLILKLDSDNQRIWIDLMRATDLAVQLGPATCSAASPRLLELLEMGIPVLSDVPDTVPLHLAPLFASASPKTSATDLAERLDRIPTRAGLTALDSVDGAIVPDRLHCDPELIADQIYTGIEGFAEVHPLYKEQQVIQAIGQIDETVRPSEVDLVSAARIIANQRESVGLPQLLLDISGTDRFDPKTGIQRVTRHLAWELLKQPPTGFVTQAVRGWEGPHEFAAHFVGEMLGCRDEVPAGILKVKTGDIFVGLDLCPEAVEDRDFFRVLRMHGVPIHFIVYDLLAIRRPELFPPVMPGVVQRWLKDISEFADGLVCISKAVADDLFEWLDEIQPRRLRPLSVGYFHLGADVNPAFDKAQIESSNEDLPNSINSHPTVLMVGTVEPRKGHALALAAMEQLWDRGHSLNLVVIGQQGWSVDNLVNKFLEHPELGKRFFWFSHASDESLLGFYRSSTVLLAASQGEGFGLPLVEAAMNGLPIIARDIPVFREVVGENAFYFPADCSADMLAERVKDWFTLREKGLVPRPKQFDWLTWEQSAQMLTEVVKGQSVYKTWRPVVHQNENSRQLVVEQLE